MIRASKKRWLAQIYSRHVSEHEFVHCFVGLGGFFLNAAINVYFSKKKSKRDVLGT